MKKLLDWLSAVSEYRLDNLPAKSGQEWMGYIEKAAAKSGLLTEYNVLNMYRENLKLNIYTLGRKIPFTDMQTQMLRLQIDLDDRATYNTLVFVDNPMSSMKKTKETFSRLSDSLDSIIREETS